MSAERFRRPSLTRAQRDAFCKAVFEDGMKISQAVKAAETGELGVPAFGGDGMWWGYRLISVARSSMTQSRPESAFQERLRLVRERDEARAEVGRLKAELRDDNEEQAEKIDRFRGALAEIYDIATREWHAESTTREFYGDIAGIVERINAPAGLPEGYPVFDMGPTVGYCSKCGEAREAFYTCRSGGTTVPKQDA